MKTIQRDDPGEYIPPRRIEEGSPVLFGDLAVSADQERGRVVSVDSNNVASIMIYSDERIESDVPFAHGNFKPDRGYVCDDQPSDAGPLGG